MENDTQPSVTGRFRYRVQKSFFGRAVLVLQIEESESYSANEGAVTGVEYRWRDARVEDLTVGLTVKP